MATGSPLEARASTIDATSAQYRSWAVPIAKGFPLLVGGEQEVVRVRWGQKPHRRANSLGGEFSLVADPAQTNELSLQITRLGAA